MTQAHMTEGDVKATVKKILDAHKIFWWMPPQNGYGRSGISDFNGIRDHVFFAIETKLHLKKRMPTAMQVGFLHSIKQEGGFAFVVTEKTAQYLALFLRAFDRSTKATALGQEVSPADGSMMLNCIKIMEELWVGGTYETLDTMLSNKQMQFEMQGVTTHGSQPN